MSLYLDIHKKFKSFSLDVSLNIGNQILAILGASGSGKSLTLGTVAGIIKPDEGKIVVNDRVIFNSTENINLPTQKRKTGLMFQNYALFPNMTVKQNLEAAQKNFYDEREINDMLHKFKLDAVKDFFPAQVSGGQQQRTALARMLLSRPQIIMLDEPFSALDSHLRFQMERELLDSLKNFEGSVLLVSHNRDEAFRLCERIAVLHNGHVEIEGWKDDVFNNPQTRNAAILTGCKNISRAEKINEGKFFAVDWGIELECRECSYEIKYLGIRMHSIKHEVHDNNCFECRVIQVIENPFSFTLMLVPENAKKNINPIGWEIDKNLWQRIKAPAVRVYFPPENILMLKE